MNLQRAKEYTEDKYILDFVLKSSRLQRGGGIPEKIYVDFEDSEYIMEGERMGNKFMYALYSKIHGDTCVSITIVPKLGIANINNLSSWKDCVVSGKKIGTKVMNITMKFLIENKNIFKINRITLTDNSQFPCGGKSLHLAIMRTLQHGETFYGKFGFLPYNSAKNEPDLKLIKFYADNIRIMQTATVDKYYDALAKCIIKSFKEARPTDIRLDNILFVLKESRDKKRLVAQFIRAFLGNYDNLCSMFELFYLELFREMGLFSFYQTVFYLDI